MEEPTDEQDIPHDVVDSDSSTSDEDDGLDEDEPEANVDAVAADDSEEVIPPDVSSLAIVDLNEPAPHDNDQTPAPVFEDPPSSDDGEGEWITPDNVATHKSREVFAGSSSSQSKTPQEPLAVACMTADYAMQNVLLHMGLNLVGLEGKKITKVKSWVLRCHACFK